MSTVVLGTLIVAVVAGGSLLSSRVEATQGAAQRIDGAAVVVLSPVCDGNTGRTLVDVVNPTGLPAGTIVRTSVDGCGLREGEQLAVQFPAGDPAGATLSGGDAADDATSGAGLLPYGIAAALLLAAAAAVVSWITGRRRQAGQPERDPMHQVVVTGDSAVVVPWSTITARRQLTKGRHARPEDDPGDGLGEDTTRRIPLVRAMATASIGAASIGAASVGAASTGAAVGSVQGLSVQGFGRGLSTADLVFPSGSSLAASLHDELFTHRTV